ncbi:heptaprenyl diphosphate synthase [Caldanaerovirga acetigignens]|uniref:Heptaprenyl diphosphate synthase n=1 Tax=Caldanaerovirga acetigignens TaxID=447595 RepID=A0A1M7I528_9FIRM|nr:polyprenyl synthetase family protein [Caldanaerovirga acetigignens]SHM35790.1 heptaprenyl diphosphate synthase [Caldanaerovirga acetigignens]
MILVERELMRIISQCKEPLSTILKNMFTGGKRLRPKLVLLSGLCFSPVNLDMIYSAVATELIHTASLIHDDVIDESCFRRNQPTINYIHGNHIAVLAGDYAFAKAFEVLSVHNLHRCKDYFVAAIQEMCHGEVMQAVDNLSIDEKYYFKIIEKKTASLISACCKAGAVCGKASEKDVEKMGLYGLYLGCAFQIVDDLLDVIGDEVEVGKPVGHDLEEGKVSLPYIYFLRESPLGSKYHPFLNDRYRLLKVKSQLISDLKKSEAVNISYAKAEEFSKKARDILSELPESVYKKLLVELSFEVVKRKK